MKTVAILCALIFFAEASVAAPLQPQADIVPPRIVLEAPADHYDKWTRPLPCPSGSFSSVMTVFNPIEHAQFASGASINLLGKETDPAIIFAFNTTKKALPLGVHVDKIGRTARDIINSQRSKKTFAPGDPITVEVAWTDSRSFSFLVNGSEQYAVELPQPVTELNLIGVGSRSVFDKNTLQCHLTS